MLALCMTDMLNFRELTISDFPKLKRFYEQYGNASCDCTICGTYMWRDYLNIRIAMDETQLIIYQQLDGKDLFYMPMMEDKKQGIREIMDYMKTVNRDCYFYPVTPEELPLFHEMGFSTEVEKTPDWNDYVYQISDLAAFRGKKYHGHKNHVNKFNSTYNNVDFLNIRDLPRQKCLDFLIDYIAKEDKDSILAKEENIRAIEILEKLDIMDVIGFVLQVDGRIIGLEVGEIINDYYYSHIEKADRSYFGAYSRLVQFTAQKLEGTVTYMNREEDLGDLGLRQSKRSYRPCGFIEKLQVLVKA